MDSRNQGEGSYPELFPKDFGERMERLIDLAGLSREGVRRAPWYRVGPRGRVVRWCGPH